MQRRGSGSGLCRQVSLTLPSSVRLIKAFRLSMSARRALRPFPPVQRWSRPCNASTRVLVSLERFNPSVNNSCSSGGNSSRSAVDLPIPPGPINTGTSSSFAPGWYARWTAPSKINSDGPVRKVPRFLGHVETVPQPRGETRYAVPTWYVVLQVLQERVNLIPRRRQLHALGKLLVSWCSTVNMRDISSPE